MRDKVYKFVHYSRKSGIRGAVSLAKKSMTKKTLNTVPNRDIFVMTDIKDVIKADFVKNPYKSPPKIEKTEKLKVGWVLSPISAGSGGQNTITRFARHLQQSGHDVTFYIYESIHPQRAVEAKKILKENFDFNVNVKSIKEYKESDVLIATGWETAYPVFNVKTKAHKFYFVQDFEPLFYGLGSVAVLAKNTYRFNFYGITAGKWLTKKVSDEFSMQADYFDFGVDLDIYKPLKMLPKQKKICFYARPVTERRAFELGIIALTIFHKKHPEYQIEFFGWDVSEFKVPFPYVNRGILTHAQLAELYRESVACLVLSLTNVSLLPFELLAAGCIPVMNDGENNSLVLGENKYIIYTMDSPIELSYGLCRAVENKGMDKEAVLASESVADKSWQESYVKVEKILKRELFKR